MSSQVISATFHTITHRQWMCGNVVSVSTHDIPVLYQTQHCGIWRSYTWLSTLLSGVLWRYVKIAQVWWHHQGAVLVSLLWPLPLVVGSQCGWITIKFGTNSSVPFWSLYFYLIFPIYWEQNTYKTNYTPICPSFTLFCQLVIKKTLLGLDKLAKDDRFLTTQHLV